MKFEATFYQWNQDKKVLYYLLSIIISILSFRSSANQQPFCPGGDELRCDVHNSHSVVFWQIWIWPVSFKVASLTLEQSHRCSNTWQSGTIRTDKAKRIPLRPRQNGRRFADDTFKYIFLNENVIISIQISLNFVPKGRINNISALVRIMAWRRPGDKPLSEPMMVSFLTHICVTQPQWVKNRDM